MKGSLCFDGRLPVLVNRKTPPREAFPGLPLNRKQRLTARHLSKFRGRVCPIRGIVTWSKHNLRAKRKEQMRRFMETGRL